MFGFISDHVALVIAIIVIGILVLGTIRNSLVLAIASLFNVIASPFVMLARAILTLLPHLRDWIEMALRGLTLPDKSGRDSDANWSGWDLIMPLLWLGLFISLLFTELYLGDLRLAALIGVRPFMASLNMPVDLFLALMFVTVTVVFAFALPELRRATLARRPWATLDDDWRRRLIKLCLVCLGLMIAAAAVLYIWGDLNRHESGAPGEFQVGLPLLFWVLLVLPLITSTGLAGWAALAAPAAVIVVVLMLGRAWLHLVHATCHAIVWILDKIAELLTRILDIFARPGAGILNFIGGHLPPGWKFPLINFIDRPRVGAEIDEPIGFQPRKEEAGRAGDGTPEPAATASRTPTELILPNGDSQRSSDDPISLPVAARRRRSLRKSPYRIRRTKDD